MYSEEYVLEHCMHNSEDVLRDVFFPMFKDELDEVVGVPNVCGYHTAVQCIKGITFDEWKRLRYVHFRKAAYLPIEEQMDIAFHDRVNDTSNWFEHVSEVKAKYPKPEDQQ